MSIGQPSAEPVAPVAGPASAQDVLGAAAGLAAKKAAEARGHGLVLAADPFPAEGAGRAPSESLRAEAPSPGGFVLSAPPGLPLDRPSRPAGVLDTPRAPTDGVETNVPDIFRLSRPRLPVPLGVTGLRS